MLVAAAIPDIASSFTRSIVHLPTRVSSKERLEFRGLTQSLQWRQELEEDGTCHVYTLNASLQTKKVSETPQSIQNRARGTPPQTS
jgi:hypothetical protein